MSAGLSQTEDDLPVAVTMGDPAGVGPLITWQAWQRLHASGRPFYVIATPAVLAAAREQLGGLTAAAELIDAPSDAAGVFRKRLPVMALDGPTPTPGAPLAATAPGIIRSVQQAVADALAGRAAAVVTNPISKALLYRAGFKHPGHTEFLAQLSVDAGEAPRPIMMLCGGGLRVALVTIHRPLASVPGALSQALIVETVGIVDTALKRDFGLNHPRLGLCGLNPHAGEEGALGAEEATIINPAAAALRASGVDISDARPGDTIFHEALGGRFDAVIAMYHDQGLIPVKTLDIWGGVNVTLGLPFIRTSPDHGTAYDAAARGEARPDSLIAALTLANRMAIARAAARNAAP